MASRLVPSPRFRRAARKLVDLLARGAVIACLLISYPATTQAGIMALNTSGQTTSTDTYGFVRDTKWQVVGVPNQTGDDSVSWSPPDGQSVTYDAYVYSSIPATWVGAGPGGTNAGVTVPNGTAYWIGANTTFDAPTGILGGGEEGQRDTAYRTTFVNTGTAGDYRLNFAATGDNFISIYVNGTLESPSANRFTVTGGTQVGTTVGDFGMMLSYDSVVPLLSGTNTLYVIIGDQGGATGMVFGGFAEPLVPTPYWAPSTGAGGTQTWNTTDTFWAPNADGSGTKDHWNNAVTYNSAAFFGGTAGTVTTDGTINVNTVNFTTNGYTITGSAGSQVNFFGVSGAIPTINLDSGVLATVNADLTDSSPDLFYALNITGTGSSPGTLVYGGSSTMGGDYGMSYNVTNATLVLTGTFAGINSAIVLTSDASFTGTGVTTGAINGEGLVAPGLPGSGNQGILTADSIYSYGSGMDFSFVLNGAAPDYGVASDSVNDVLRLKTGGDPFNGTPLGAGSEISVFFRDITATTTQGLHDLTGDSWAGGFFSDVVVADYLASIIDASYLFYIYGDGQGTHSYSGLNYYSLQELDPNGMYHFVIGTEAVNAAFADGAVDGRIMTFTLAEAAVPEIDPAGMGSVLSLVVGALGLLERRRLRAA